MSWTVEQAYRQNCHVWHMKLSMAIPDNGLQLHRTSYAVRAAFSATTGSLVIFCPREVNKADHERFLTVCYALSGILSYCNISATCWLRWSSVTDRPTDGTKLVGAWPNPRLQSKVKISKSQVRVGLIVSGLTVWNSRQPELWLVDCRCAFP